MCYCHFDSIRLALGMQLYVILTEIEKDDKADPKCSGRGELVNSIGNTINKIYVKIMEELCIIKTLY